MMTVHRLSHQFMLLHGDCDRLRWHSITVAAAPSHCAALTLSPDIYLYFDGTCDQIT